MKDEAERKARLIRHTPDAHPFGLNPVHIAPLPARSFASRSSSWSR